MQTISTPEFGDRDAVSNARKTAAVAIVRVGVNFASSKV